MRTIIYLVLSYIYFDVSILFLFISITQCNDAAYQINVHFTFIFYKYISHY